MYDIRSKDKIAAFKDHSPVQQIAFDQKKLIARTDVGIKVYDLRVNGHLHDLTDPNNQYPSTFTTIDANSIVSGNRIGQLYHFDTNTAIHTQIATNLHNGPVRVLSCDGKMVYSTADDGKIGVIDIASKSLHATLTGHKGAVNALVGDNGTKLVSGGADNSIKVWDTSKAKALYSLLGGSLQARSNNPVHPTTPGISCLSYDESRIVASTASLLKIYDFEVYKGEDNAN